MLIVDRLCTEYPNDRGQTVRAAQDVSFKVPEGKLFTLLGPSGCGKTTTLRSIAGLERPKLGTISVAGATVFSAEKNIFVQPNKRNFGMVFQSYAIWPHMNVFRNAAFPLEVGPRKFSRREIEQRVMRVLEAVGLDQFAGREATRMSGGQQQRLALARALVMEPKLLLLDEPLSNLDAKLRERMRFELKRMQRELGLTTIYVTHDQSEALALSHEIAVMSEGRVVQIGAPRDIYVRPRSRFVADFVGLTNFLDATVDGPAEGDGRYRVTSEIGPLTVSLFDPGRAGEQILVSVRPEDIELSSTQPQGDNVVAGKVALKVFLGEYVDYQIALGERRVLARAHPTFDVPVGSPVFIQMRAEKCISVPGDPARKAA
ncbi:ABC transporter ATP-binding protein [Pigmentiphaga soli]|uniref:ABC transporter ATP-binding protein n=1 Tax=Pigmentiphaga soli TaxID=1007095 RepID=A0ABP8HAK0_9BURK